MVRLKHRYLLATFVYPTSIVKGDNNQDAPNVIQFNQPSPRGLSNAVLSKLIREGVAELFGDLGAGNVATGLKINYLSPTTSTAIIRAPRSHYRMVWAALTHCTKLPHPLSQECVISVVRVSGTIRKAEDEAIRRAKVLIQRAKNAEKDDMDNILRNMTGPTAAASAVHPPVVDISDDEGSPAPAEAAEPDNSDEDEND